MVDACVRWDTDEKFQGHSLRTFSNTHHSDEFPKIIPLIFALSQALTHTRISFVRIRALQISLVLIWTIFIETACTSKNSHTKFTIQIKKHIINLRSPRLLRRCISFWTDAPQAHHLFKWSPSQQPEHIYSQAEITSCNTSLKRNYHFKNTAIWQYHFEHCHRKSSFQSSMQYALVLSSLHPPPWHDSPIYIKSV